MGLRSTPPELGERIAVHHPVSPLLAWTFLVAISSPFAILAAVGPPGPVVGLGIFALFLVPLTYGLTEWLLLRHEVFEHGIVFASIPTMRRYVVPFSTVHPDSVDIRDRFRVPRGELHIAQPQHRETPFAQQSTTFTGLNAADARKIAKGRLSLAEVLQESGGNSHLDHGREVTRWRASSRDPETNRHLLVETIRTSQAAISYNRRDPA